jgi:hypothetical protein
VNNLESGCFYSCQSLRSVIFESTSIVESIKHAIHFSHSSFGPIIIPTSVGCLKIQ